MTTSIQVQSAYPTAEAVMNRARAFVNDAFRGGKGRILTDTASFTIEFLNAALEELQDKIGNNGVITLIKDNVILGPLTPIAEPDPSIQTWVGYTGYYDGTEMHALPVLPSDLRAVFEVWERQVGSCLPFTPMQQPQGPLPSKYQGQWLNLWEYRQDRINMIGSTTTEEIRIRYESRQQTITDADTLANTQIGILSSVNALATIVAYVYARARGAQAAATMQADYAIQMRYIVRRYTRRAQEQNFQRRPYSAGGGNNTNGYGTNLPM
jgi:hypothetical protein